MREIRRVVADDEFAVNLLERAHEVGRGEATCGDDEVEAREGGTRGTRREGNERTKERRVVTVVHC